MFKKLLSFFIAAVLLLSCFAVVSQAADSNAVSSFCVTAFSDNAQTKVKLFKGSDNNYYLFMPAGADLSSLEVTFNGNASVNGKSLQSGAVTDVFKKTGEYSLKLGSATYKLVVLQSKNIPAVYITTESGSLDYIHANKENKEPGNIVIIENGKQTLNSELKQIKGRGNATWGLAKKPYNIKFDKKTSLFGMAKAKKWSLLANYLDLSLLRNSVAFDMGKIMGLDYTSEYQSIDLYVNNEYQGNYLVTESVEVGSSRVDINDLDNANEDANPDVDIDSLSRGGTGENESVLPGSVKGSRKWVNFPNDPADITGGYLLEIEMTERYDPEISGFITNRGQAIVLKSPETATKSEVNYIADFFQDAEDAISSPTGYNSKNKHYSEYFDMESLAKMYIIEEYSMEIDIGLSSNYFYKPEGEDKLYAGPVWDFDHGFANPDDGSRWGVDRKNTQVWLANQTTTLYSKYLNPTIFKYAYFHEDFRDVVSDVWGTYSDTFKNSYRNTIKAYGELIADSAVMDEFRWNRNSLARTYSAKLDGYNKHINLFCETFTQRAVALNKGFSKDSAMLYYDANGGDGYAINQKIALIGESVVLTDEQYMSNGDYIFTGWNTEADGSGHSYRSGDSVRLNGKTTILYAQWEKATFNNIIKNLFNKISEFFRSFFEFISNMFR